MRQSTDSQSNAKSSGKEAQMTKSSSTDTEGNWTATMAAEDYAEKVVLYQALVCSLDHDPADAIRLHWSSSEWELEPCLAEAEACKEMQGEYEELLSYGRKGTNNSDYIAQLEYLQGAGMEGFGAYVVEGLANRAEFEAADFTDEFRVEPVGYRFIDRINGEDLDDQAKGDLQMMAGEGIA